MSEYRDMNIYDALDRICEELRKFKKDQDEMNIRRIEQETLISRRLSEIESRN